MAPKERREFQRLKLTRPILATMRGANALILDIGIGGAMLEHYGTATLGDRFPLVFRWQGQEVALTCEVMRSTVARAQSGDGESITCHTGVRFHDIKPDAATSLQELISSFLGHILAAQKANAAGERGESSGQQILARLGHAHRTRSRGFVAWHFANDSWTSQPTEVRRQAADGFTVGTHEDEAEVESLCRAYEHADAAGRDLIRLVAELSTLKEE